MGKARIIGVAAALAVAAGLAATPLLAEASSSSGSQASPSTTAAPAATRVLDDDVHLNQIQVTGSHNSYHILPPAKEVALRHTFIGDGDKLMEYRHAPLPQQFESQKVRQIELDLFLDPTGGKYANPLLRSVAGDGAYDPVMNQPGIKVLHVQDVDYASTCLTFKACLTQVKQWSDANPTHAPIAILLELKDDDVPFSGFDFVHPDPFNAAAMNTVDAEIRSVLPPSDLITPDDVRGSHATLQEAVTTDGWPTLGESRGKIMFLMDNGGDKRTAYLAGHPNLEGRAVFTNAPAGAPDAAFVEHNEASDVAVIQDLVQQGYVVRTRADGDTTEARENDTSDRDDAYRSGAQWVSTDYPVPGWAIGFTSPYYSEIPGGTVARCNPVNAPPSCVSAQIDTIYHPVTTPPPSTTSTTTSTLPPATVPDDDVDPATGAQPVSGAASYTG